MAENVHIGEIAEKLSDELFGEFLWTKVGPTNIDWPCEEHEKHAVKTHPADVVFFYDEPYSQIRTYVHCDLKSYAKGSITPTAVTAAVESLSRQVACAEKSEKWHQLYAHDNASVAVCGLLFVYNHDGEYDRNFSNLLNSVRTDKLDLPAKSKLVVLSPEDIFWLDNVRYEIQLMRGSAKVDRLPDREHCQYFYPQLVRKANVQVEKARAATLEMLTSPWVILEYKNPKTSKRGFVVFYRRQGATPQEFMYLFDYLRHYQVLRDDTDVQIKLLETSPTASVNFQKAIQQYNEMMSDGNTESELSRLVKAIKYSKMTQVVSTFSSIELGMDYE